MYYNDDKWITPHEMREQIYRCLFHCYRGMGIYQGIRAWTEEKNWGVINAARTHKAELHYRVKGKKLKIDITVEV
jgi:hypothetical protein